MGGLVYMLRLQVKSVMKIVLSDRRFDSVVFRRVNPGCEGTSGCTPVLAGCGGGSADLNKQVMGFPGSPNFGIQKKEKRKVLYSFLPADPFPLHKLLFFLFLYARLVPSPLF